MTKPHAIKFSKIADMIKNEPDKPKLFMRTRFKGLNTNVPIEIVLTKLITKENQFFITI